MGVFGLLIMSALGLGSIFAGSSSEDDVPAEDDSDELAGNAQDDTLTEPSDQDGAPQYDGTDQTGTDGDDELLGGALGDVLHGGAGDDTLRGGAGDDLIYGGDGSDLVEGGDGDDVLYAGSTGFEQVPSSSEYNSVNGGDGNDTIYDSSGHDLMHGGEGDDVLYAGLGDDDITGGRGDDIIVGKPSFKADGSISEYDTFYGGDGNDELSGVGFLSGDRGDDILSAEATYNGVGAAITSAGDHWSDSITYLKGGLGVDTFVVGYNFDPTENLPGSDTAPTGQYDPVRIADFDPSSEALLITVDAQVAANGIYSTNTYSDRTEIVVDDADGNQFVAAILENVTGDISGADIRLIAPS